MKLQVILCILIFSTLAFGNWQMQTENVNVPSSFDDEWSLVILPDVQFYSDVYPGLFDLQAIWVRDNAERINAKYVLLPGDITNGNSEREWENASDSLSILDKKVPYVMCPGNHDSGESGWAGDRTTLMDKHFPYQRLKGWSGIAGCRTKGQMSNTYHFFTGGDGSEWLILSFEWSPTDETLAWGQQILKKFSDKKAIIMTHAYMYNDSTRYDWETKGKEQKWNPHSYKTKNGNDGQGIWEKLIKDNKNVFLVISGHVLGDGTGVLISQNSSGGDVIQMLANYQTPINDIGGQAWIRVLTFSKDMKKITCWTYSPLYKKYRDEEDQLFEFSIK
jgi:Calcineurin-like phosphoesterase